MVTDKERAPQLTEARQGTFQRRAIILALTAVVLIATVYILYSHHQTSKVNAANNAAAADIAQIGWYVERVIPMTISGHNVLLITFGAHGITETIQVDDSNPQFNTYSSLREHDVLTFDTC